MHSGNGRDGRTLKNATWFFTDGDKRKYEFLWEGKPYDIYATISGYRFVTPEDLHRALYSTRGISRTLGAAVLKVKLQPRRSTATPYQNFPTPNTDGGVITLTHDHTQRKVRAHYQQIVQERLQDRHALLFVTQVIVCGKDQC